MMNGDGRGAPGDRFVRLPPSLASCAVLLTFVPASRFPCPSSAAFLSPSQEVSTMLRYGLNPIIFLINNGGYTIEVEIHDG